MKTAKLSGFQLKMIAIVAMTIDHAAWVLFPGYSLHPAAIVLHLIGRLTAPIMCFFIAEGVHYTHDVKKYFLRVLLFAIPSHFAYMFCFGHSLLPFQDGVLNQTSVLWPFAWGIAALAVAKSSLKDTVKYLLTALFCVIAFPSDWSCIAVLVIVGFGCNRGDFKKQAGNLIFFVACYAVVYIACLDLWYGVLQMGVVLALPLLRLYSGERGGKNTAFSKWFFYLYYPAHLLLLGGLRLLLQ